MPAQITPFSTTPSRSNPSTFSADMDTRIIEEGRFADEANALSLEVNGLAASVAASVIAVPASPVWVSGTTYAAGDCRYSPANYQTYRRKTNGAGTTDPSADTTNWASIGNVAMVGGFTPSQTPAASQIPVVKSDGTTAFPGGISVGNATSGDSPSTLFSWCEKATCGVTATGFASTAPSGTASFSRNNGTVTLTIPQLTGTSNSTSFTIGTLPTSARPSSVKNCVVRGVQDNTGTVVFGWVSIGTNGVITVYPSAAGTSISWTASGTKTINASTITYDL